MSQSFLCKFDCRVFGLKHITGRVPYQESWRVRLPPIDQIQRHGVKKYCLIPQSLKDSPVNAESMRYLKKTGQRVRETARSSRGTIRKLKLIDSLNDFLSVSNFFFD